MQHRNDRFAKFIGTAIAAGLFYLGTAIVIHSGQPITPRAEAQMIAPSLTQTHEDVLVTSSLDGSRLHLWTFGDGKLLDANRFLTYQGYVDNKQ
jgi:hypothetical protein